MLRLVRLDSKLQLQLQLHAIPAVSTTQCQLGSKDPLTQELLEVLDHTGWQCPSAPVGRLTN